MSTKFPLNFTNIFSVSFIKYFITGKKHLHDYFRDFAESVLQFSKTSTIKAKDQPDRVTKFL